MLIGSTYIECNLKVVTHWTNSKKRGQYTSIAHWTYSIQFSSKQLSKPVNLITNKQKASIIIILFFLVIILQLFFFLECSYFVYSYSIYLQAIHNSTFKDFYFD